MVHKKRCEALFYTFFILGTKVAISIYLGVGQYILDVTGGYLNNVCAEYQPPSVSTVLRNLFVPLPLILSFVSSLCVYFYPLTELTTKRNAIQLRNMQNSSIDNSKINSGYSNDENHNKKRDTEKY